MKINYKKFPFWHLIGPLILIAAVWMAGPAKIWQVISCANYYLFLVAVVLSVPIVILKTIRWQLLLRSYKISISFLEAVRMYCVGMTLSVITPGKFGDMIKIVILSRKGVEVAKAIACNIIDRLFDFCFVLIVGGIGTIYLYDSLHLKFDSAAIVFLLSLFLIFILVMIRKKALISILKRLIPQKYRSLTKDSIIQFWQCFRLNRIAIFASLSFWTVVLWLVQFFALYLCALALDIQITFIYFCICSAIATLVSLLPVTIAGVGTRDMIFILLLGRIGISQQQCIALSTLILGTYLLDGVVFYIISALISEKN